MLRMEAFSQEPVVDNLLVDSGWCWGSVVGEWGRVDDGGILVHLEETMAFVDDTAEKGECFRRRLS